MRKHTLSLGPSTLEKWFGQLSSVELVDDQIIITTKNAQNRISLESLDTFPSNQTGLFGDRLILIQNNRKTCVKGIAKRHLHNETRQLIQAYIPYYETAVADCWIQYRKQAQERYLRDSQTNVLSLTIGKILNAFKTNQANIINQLSLKTRQTITLLQDIHPLQVDTVRENFEKTYLANKKEFFNSVESYPLTEEQSLAVIRDNDRNLVLAAAGTGKTSVMVAKALDIVIGGLARPDQVLVLAFGSDAAVEVNERIEKRCKQLLSNLNPAPPIQSDAIQASTFHALGLKILKATGKNTFLSKFATSDNLKQNWIHRQLVEYLKADKRNLSNFITLMYPKSNPLDFKTRDEYERFIRDNEYITLNGDRVRSYQEVLIGNWLFVNGIPHRYEANYKVKTRVEIGFDYKPDFHIEDTDIFIEHYGIDREGNTRQGIDKESYNANIIKKRDLHARHGTRLIETYHYEWCDGTLLAHLESNLAELDIEAQPVSDNQLFDKLNELGLVSKFAEIMTQAVSATRIESLNIEQARQRLKNAAYANTEAFIPVLDAMKSAYENELREHEEIDFDDMILQAVDCVRTGEYMPTWKYILVDEFQDISQSRMNLVQALLDAVSDSALFAVGDDWQSIYRFAGGKLEITTRFSEYVGSHTLTRLQKTFRYNNSIADTAGRFIMQNPEQYQKQVITHDQVDRPQIYLIDSTISNENKKSSPESRISSVVKKIIANDPAGSIAVLARYNSVLDKAKEELKLVTKSRQITFLTFHRSKGLEADYCVLAGFTQGQYGFPNDNKDHEAVNALLPTLDAFPYTEERRLMYVALTRARKKCYLIVDPLVPSKFVNELITDDYAIDCTSDNFSADYRQQFKCGHCKDGYLLKQSGPHGPYYICSNRPGCRIRKFACKQCQSPMDDNNKQRICRNPDCRESIKLCPRCYRPLRLIKNEYWGCTGYYPERPGRCRYTRKNT